jgi:hypothetical protein
MVTRMKECVTAPDILPPICEQYDTTRDDLLTFVDVI